MRTIPIFVYGTLLDIDCTDCPVFTSIKGFAANIKWFPALLSVGGMDNISGELRWVTPDTLAEYDRYEGSMYTKTATTTTCGTHCIVYMWNGSSTTAFSHFSETNNGIWRGLYNKENY